MLRDRGNIKWTSLMLVEHKEKLKELKKKEENKNKVELLEDELKRFDYILQEALYNHYKVKIVYYKKKHFHQWIGWIKECRPATREITLSSSENVTEGKKIILELDDIINLEIFT